jgi:hypothetical protein
MKKQSWSFYIVLCLSLGLAPWWFRGEPHIIGKLKWVFGGGEGMKPLDYFDLVFHGAPWVLLSWKVLREFVLKKEKQG